MATNTEKIEDLAERMTKIETLLHERLSVRETENKEELTRLNSALVDHTQRLATIEERCRNLERQFEKHADRTWQFIPILISTLAIIVSLIVAFVKK